MSTKNTHAVTGAFGYSGKYIAERLLAEGKNVFTLTNSTHRRNPLGDRLRAIPFHFEAAKTAGVERIVHVSITNPTEDSPLEYFSGKAHLEHALVESGLSHAILRPTVLFG